MNLPNRLTVFRLFMVPFCVAATVIPEKWLNPDVSAVIAAAIFILAAVTDAADGKIARKYNLITDFGKFLDPLADKFMVIGVMLAICYRYESIRVWFFWVALIVVFRELAVTSLRLMVANSETHRVIAAAWLGKLKTVFQMVCIVCVFIEPVVYHRIFSGDTLRFLTVCPPLTVLFSALTVLFTVLSAVDYFKTYGSMLDSSK
ncbi:MAG: CDP-diacylglycerol--glycerol-3-phosphate 3-phosphatidyltransferase [Clostridia bacterium]|nr:CDP-diacylglycerol--glycerol-3-phosphate 3-phosphatidyltransferase [Clostridia bacterium]